MLNGESRLFIIIIILEHFESFDILSNITKGIFLSLLPLCGRHYWIRSKGTSEFRQPFVNK
jgi:hypothetical protein